jgi:hypothetical protein
MGAIAIDLNNTAEVRTTGRRVLVDALGADGARAFLNDYVKEQNERPRITAEQIAAIKTKAMAEAEAGRGKGTGDYTAERHETTGPSHEEIVADSKRLEMEMDNIQREHPEYTLQERLREHTRREAVRRGIAMAAV